VSLDDDIHVIEKVFHFATVLLHENPSSSQSNAYRHANNEPSTEQEQIHACHCMSLPIAFQNTRIIYRLAMG
jgi:hypothetical protein